jgi:hypothetical protein
MYSGANIVGQQSGMPGMLNLCQQIVDTQPLRSTENHQQVEHWQDVPMTASVPEPGCAVRTQSAPNWSAGALQQLLQHRHPVLVGRLPVTDVTRPSHLSIGQEFSTAASLSDGMTSHPVNNMRSMPLAANGDGNNSSPKHVRSDADTAACCDVRIGNRLISFRFIVGYGKASIMVFHFSRSLIATQQTSLAVNLYRISQFFPS